MHGAWEGKFKKGGGVCMEYFDEPPSYILVEVFLCTVHVIIHRVCNFLAIVHENISSNDFRQVQ